MKKEDKENCIFCKIIKGKSTVSIVYEDDKVIVFPPLRPVNKGHLLIVPKVHIPYLADLNVDLAMYMMKITKMIVAGIKKSKYKSEGINSFLADGEASGQEVFHIHLHAYPRFYNDGFGFKYDLTKHFVKPERTELDEIAQEIKNNIE